jgi:membrane-associated phospholipid phosphatase
MLPCRSFLVLPTLALLVALGTASPVAAAVADSSVSLPRSPDTWSNATSRGSLLSRRDVWFAAGTVGAIVLATKLDRWAAEEAPENSGATAVRLSHGAEHLGNPLYVLPGILFVHAANALEHRPDRAGSLMRIVEGAGAAVVATSIVKLAVGRARPYETPGDQDVMRPFSGYTAFPSGHTAFAFGLASAIDQETKARWVPYVVYPLAAMVGWSRLRDNKHWLSDVVAGASIGTWTARKVVRLARRAMRTN